MDRFVYIAMTAATQTELAQARNVNNLANAVTTGFRGALDAFVSRPVSGPGFDSRTYASDEKLWIDFAPGATYATGRSLDVAIDGDGWIVVQALDGTEAFTRAGDLRVDPTGILTTAGGLPVLGDGGPIAVPPHESIIVGSDGTISIRPLGQEANLLAQVDRIRLVNPPREDLERREDGLIRRIDGEEEEPDPGVRLMSGMLESSNVRTVDAMVKMIEYSRQFEMQMKMIKTAEENDSAAAKLLGLS